MAASFSPFALFFCCAAASGAWAEVYACRLKVESGGNSRTENNRSQVCRFAMRPIAALGSAVIHFPLLCRGRHFRRRNFPIDRTFAPQISCLGGEDTCLDI
jgi:hypothetical protein